MNELDVLKRLRDDVPGPTPLVLARAELKLQAPPRHRHLSRPRLLLVGALAAALTGGLLVSDVITHDGGPAPGAVADASTFLTNAAELTNERPDAPIPAGQYRQVTQQVKTTGRFGPDGRYSYTSLSMSDLWVPADQKPPYTAIRKVNVKRTYSSPAASEFYRTMKAPVWGHWGYGGFEAVMPNPHTTKSRDACGMLPLHLAFSPQNRRTKPVCTPGWTAISSDFLARLPRNPDALLALLRAAPTETNRRPQTTPPVPGWPEVVGDIAFERITMVLASGIAPADLRAALYQAARKISGVRLENGVVNLAGRDGRAIGRVGLKGIRRDLIIDPKTGEFLGLREVATVTAPNDYNTQLRGFKRGDVVTLTSITSRITPTRPVVR